MPKVARSIEEVDAVREQVLEVAFNIIKKSGYEGLKMAKIATKMHMTAANLYNYYVNKDELLIAIHKKAHLMLYDEISRAVETANTPLEKVKNLTYAYVVFGTENKNIYDIMFNRPIRHYLDYIGTPQEAMSYDELQSSQNVLSFALKTIQAYLETRRNKQSLNLTTVANRSIMILHGIITMRNSGTLPYMIRDFEKPLDRFIDEIMESILWPPEG
jgi:AcrR family transcriptional regulator